MLAISLPTVCITRFPSSQRPNIIPAEPYNIIQDDGGSVCLMSQLSMPYCLQLDATAHKAITGPMEFLER